jgi:XTP/dITP diphosphohydrolase
VSRDAVLLATRSPGKIRELRPLFERFGVPVIDLDDAGVPLTEAEDALEVHATFEENALAKARYFFALTRRACVADDSGLTVSALGGAPGVFSKRWSQRPDLSGQALDDENNRLLVRSLCGAADRSARYVCAAAFVAAGRELTERGEVVGRILEEARGAGGFGYDPYFYSDELGRGFGEASREEKARVSHRARAFRQLISRLRW